MEYCTQNYHCDSNVCRQCGGNQFMYERMMEREIDWIIVHCSATRADRDITAKDIDSFHRVRGFSSWGYHYYVRKDGRIERMRDESEPGAHAYGYNHNSIAVCYEGGLDVNGRPADTRTLHQKRTLHALLRSLKGDYPKAVIKGHRDLSPDVNGNGRVDKWERTKECPCFDAMEEYQEL